MNYVSVCFQRTGTSRFFKGADTTNVGRIMEINGRRTDKNGTGEILFAVYTPSQKTCLNIFESLGGFDFLRVTRLSDVFV